MHNTPKPAHPIVFLFLALPSGIMQGYLTVTLAFVYSKAGISVEQVAALIGLSLVPNIFKFVWAPLVDTTLTVKKWFLLTNIITSVGVLCMGILKISPANITLISIIVFITFLPELL